MVKCYARRKDSCKGPKTPSPKKRKTKHTEEEEEEEEEDDDDDSDEDYEEEEDDEDESEEEVGNCQKGTNHGGSVEDGSFKVTVTDPEVFDCPICLELLTIPVFQCDNGHTACRPCCSVLMNRCPSCSLPIGHARCRAIEKVLESVKVLCLNKKYGCKETVALSSKRDHAKKCVYTQCSCPVPDCNFVSNSERLYLHFRNRHPASAKRFSYNRRFSISLAVDKIYHILQEQKEGVIFIVNNEVEPHGNAISVSCIGPRSSELQFAYDLIAKNGGSSISLQSFPDNISTCGVENLRSKQFLVVPSGYVGSDGLLKLEPRIRKLN